MKNKKLLKQITPYLIIIVIALVVFSIILILYLTSEKKMTKQPKYKKVFILGIDGMDPKVTSQLIAEGKLPNFKKLSDTGSYLLLNTSTPPESPVAWTSIATGTNPGKHGLFDFIRRDPKKMVPELSLSKASTGLTGTQYNSYVKAEPFWITTSNFNVPTTIIRWPLTFPPEEIKGNILSGLGVPDIKGLLSGYTFFTTQEVKHDKTSPNSLMQVRVQDGVIDTEIGGPRVQNFKQVGTTTTPLRIKINNKGSDSSATLILGKKEYEVNEGEWSEWIRVEFKIGPLKKVYGIFKVHVNSLEPFEMFATTVQIDPKNPVVDISYPKDYSAQLAKEIGLFSTLGMPEETDAFSDGRLDSKAFQEHLAQLEEEKDAIFWKEFENFKQQETGLYAFVYDASDRIQHMYWDDRVLEQDEGATGDENNDKNKISINSVVSDFYARKDALLGKVLNQLDKDNDNETALFIVSDHGFTSFERAVCINTWLYENGYLSLKKDAKITEQDSGALFKYVNWTNTKAYALGFASIYINLKDREAKGIVSEQEKQALVDEIIKKLEFFGDEKTGKRVIYKAYRKEDIYTGDYVDEAPDIIIGFNPGYRMDWKTPIGGFSTEIITDNSKQWKGDHLVDPSFVPGVLFSNLKLKQSGGSSHQTDLAPTILDAFGIPIPSKLDGKSLLR